MNAAPRQLDLTAPPIVKTIGQRSLIVAAVFGIAALALAFLRTDEFFRAYLLGYMCWLGVALGSMAIIMIRHLTGGGWGVVIRRIQGACRFIRQHKLRAIRQRPCYRNALLLAD